MLFNKEMQRLNFIKLNLRKRLFYFPILIFINQKVVSYYKSISVNDLPLPAFGEASPLLGKEGVWGWS